MVNPRSTTNPKAPAAAAPKKAAAASAKAAPGNAAPADVDSLLEKAFELHRAGKIAQAAAGYKNILKIAPNNVDAVHLMGLALRAYGRDQDAEIMFRRTVVLNPKFADAYYNLGNACFAQGKFRKSIDAYEKAAALQPENAVIQFNLGNAYRDLGDPDEAAAAFRRAIALKDDYIDAWHNLANVLKDGGFLKQAIECYRATLKLDPKLAEANYNLAILLLLASDMPRGFDLYEWRHQIPGLAAPNRDFGKPQWLGKPIKGRTILIHAEQGFGDTIQFSRYLPLVAERGAKVVVECQPSLAGLVRRIPGVSVVVETGKPLPDFDLHCPIPSLPRAFRTTRDDIPAKPVYLEANPLAVKEWRTRLNKDGAMFRIGLVWSGNPQHGGGDAQRALAVRELMILPQLPQIRYYSLQRGQAERELVETGLGNVVPNLAPQIDDFDDLAGALSGMDLLLAIDSAPAHLAAALGKPVWLIVPNSPDWRWTLMGESTPWYPSMRLFRQKERGEWAPLMTHIAAEMLALVQSKVS
jgi:tetratricopeptide (TPR) repeat protein